jgi:amidase
MPFNCTGHPAISVPCGASGGLPIGMMLVAKHFEEAVLYQAAAAFERSFSRCATRGRTHNEGTKR